MMENHSVFCTHPDSSNVIHFCRLFAVLRMISIFSTVFSYQPMSHSKCWVAKCCSLSWGKSIWSPLHLGPAVSKDFISCFAC